MVASAPLLAKVSSSSFGHASGRGGGGGGKRRAFHIPFLIPRKSTDLESSSHRNSTPHNSSEHHEEDLSSCGTNSDHHCQYSFSTVTSFASDDASCIFPTTDSVCSCPPGSSGGLLDPKAAYGYEKPRVELTRLLYFDPLLPKEDDHEGDDVGSVASKSIGNGSFYQGQVHFHEKNSSLFSSWTSDEGSVTSSVSFRSLPTMPSTKKLSHCMDDGGQNQTAGRLMDRRRATRSRKQSSGRFKKIKRAFGISGPPLQRAVQSLIEKRRKRTRDKSRQDKFHSIEARTPVLASDATAITVDDATLTTMDFGNVEDILSINSQENRPMMQLSFIQSEDGNVQEDDDGRSEVPFLHFECSATNDAPEWTHGDRSENGTQNANKRSECEVTLVKPNIPDGLCHRRTAEELIRVLRLGPGASEAVRCLRETSQTKDAAFTTSSQEVASVEGVSMSTFDLFGISIPKYDEYVEQSVSAFRRDVLGLSDEQYEELNLAAFNKIPVT